MTQTGPKRKIIIPKALREQVWICNMGRDFEAKCKTNWCTNIINVFDFQCGHNIPESRGGLTILTNLVPICARCNLSMSDSFTFDEWSRTLGPATVGEPAHWNCCGTH